MSKHQKTLTPKQKIIFYSTATTVSIVAAVVAVLILIFAITRPSDSGFNNNKYNRYSTSSNSSGFVADSNNYLDSDTKSKAPKITGIQNGTVYYTTQHVVVKDTNLVSVTINGEDSEKQFFIDGNDTNMYVIEAVDADYNTTTYTVYTKTIHSLLDDIRHLNTYTVTADYYDIISDVKNTAINLDTSYSTADEFNAIDEVLTTSERLLKKLDDVHKKISTITKTMDNCEKNGNYTNANTVITDIDALLATENLTQSQRNTLQKMRSKCQSWLAENF